MRENRTYGLMRGGSSVNTIYIVVFAALYSILIYDNRHAILFVLNHIES